MRKGFAMKPQDILLVLKIIVRGNKNWRQLDLANELGVSQSEVALSLDRLRHSGLIDEEKQKPQRMAIFEFLVHGLRYVFPAEIGGLVRGIPTAHSYGILSKNLIEDSFPFVWPSDEGELRGQSVYPLYKTVPFAAKRDPAFYQVLALIDSLRIGRAREREMATAELKKIVLNGAPEESLRRNTL